MLYANITELPYRPSANYFRLLRDMAWPVWLDSGEPADNRGRFDILAANPRTMLSSSDDQVCITDAHTGTSRYEQGNPLTILSNHLPAPCNLPKGSNLPFCGGAIGYFGYDLGRQFEQLPSLTRKEVELPDMQVGIYAWAVIQDHETQTAYLVTLPDLSDDDRFDLISTLNKHQEEKVNSFKINELISNLNKEDYINRFNRVQHYIRAGDCYQVNLAQCFSGNFSGDPLTAYLQLRQALPSPYSGFFEPAQGCLLSLSPERFISSRDGLVTTQPIKGTMPRSQNPVTDRANAQQLQDSEKDQAENLMIVDLLRNDLNRVCTPSSVVTRKLFELQSYANVHHLVSTIEGRLSDQQTPLSLLQHCFPGGSITGAPKIRAMEIIEELEPCRRSIYCGSLGYISADQQMDSSITIRTLVCDDGKIYCWGGGGIVADSDPQLEYQETLGKIGLILDTLNAM